VIERTTPIGWQIGTISEIVQRTPSIKSFFLRLAQPFTHVAGQHVDIRLTAPDGYSAMRSYSIASDPSRSDAIELVIENLQGEVSAYFHEVAVAGDEIELRGPLGGHFLWPEPESGPILLIGAGSGVAPFMSMIRHRRSVALTVPTALLLRTDPGDYPRGTLASLGFCASGGRSNDQGRRWPHAFYACACLHLRIERLRQYCR
jgi:NAD(P)H-flavin reductase